jgi:hypothetical protein
MQNNQWNEFAALHARFERQRLEFLATLKPVVSVLQEALKDAGTRGAALELVNHISDDERKQLFEDLLMLACYAHKYQNDAFLAVCTLPRQWAATQVEDYLPSILNRATEEEFGLLLHILNEINLDVGFTVARRHLESPDGGIRRIAQAFIGHA